MLDVVCHLMRIFSTARSLSPNGESLETLEKASGTLKKAKSKTDGEVPAQNASERSCLEISAPLPQFQVDDPKMTLLPNTTVLASQLQGH